MEVYGRIYGIEYLGDHRIYVGQTTRKVKVRIAENRKNRRTHIGRAIHKYGWKNFVWTVLEKCYSQEELDDAERRWVEKLNCVYPNGFNRSSGGIKDFKPCNRTREQMSEAQKKREFSQEFKALLAKKNKHHSPESYKKTSATKKRYRFYPNLETELEKNNLTHRKLAQLLGITKSTMYYKLSGKGKISLELRRTIKEILQTDLSIEELFKHED